MRTTSRRWGIITASMATFAAVVVAIATSASVARAQTPASLPVSAVPNPLPSVNNGSEVNAVNALLADLRSPDPQRRRTASKQIVDIREQGQQTIGRTLLALAKQQVQAVKEADAVYAKHYELVEKSLAKRLPAKRTPAEEQADLEEQKALAVKVDIAEQTIRLLGGLRVEDAIPFLLQNIRFMGTGILRRWNMPYLYPCLGALMDIGLAAAEAMVKAIEEDSINMSASGQGEFLGRIIWPRAASGLIQDRIALIQPKKPLSEKLPGPVLPVPVRINRLEAVRAYLEEHAQELVGWRQEWKGDRTW